MLLDTHGDSVGGFFCSGSYQPTIDEKLKPCPFCKSTDLEVTNTHTPCYRVYCCGCDAEGPPVTADDLVPRPGSQRRWSKTKMQQVHRAVFERTIVLWNTRNKNLSGQDRT